MLDTEAKDFIKLLIGVILAVLSFIAILFILLEMFSVLRADSDERYCKQFHTDYCSGFILTNE